MEKPVAFVIEDDMDSANLFRSILDLLGYSTEIFLYGTAAINCMKNSTPSLVMLDLKLPGEASGVEVLKYMRKQPRLERTQVLVITGHAEMSAEIQDMADLLLFKPVSFDELEQFVRRIATPEQRTLEVASTDPVTGLFNRAFLLERAQHVIERRKRNPDLNFGVVHLKVDQFESILNESGVELEQLFLVEISRQLRLLLRATDTVARYARSEFIILLEELKQPEDVQIVVSRLADLFNGGIELEGETYKLTASIGAVQDPDGNANPEQILFQAVEAMGLALRKGGGEVEYV
jgi:diguanylate cyclase (GGDEF)-like protein